MKKIVFIGFVVALSACGRSSEGGGELQTEHQAQGIENVGGDGLDRADELVASTPLAYHADPIPGELGPMPVPPDVPRSTEEKLGSPTWPQQLAAKQAKKEEAARAANNPVPVPTASPGMAAKQERFFEMIRQRQAELDALDPATREQVYADLKRKEFGE